MVKRYKVEVPPANIRRIHTIFAWRDCEICSMQFRREYGWEHGQVDGGRWYYTYFCGTCCPSWQTVDSKMYQIKGWKRQG